MSRICLASCTAIITLTAGAASTCAQDATVEARLREALRRTTIDLRALQDGQAALTAERDHLKQENDQLRQQLQAAETAPAKPDPALDQLRTALAALEQQNKELTAGLAKWQSAYQQAASVARDKDAESRQLGMKLKDTTTRFEGCKTANDKLITVANDILHLYRTQSFHSLLIGSYEPVLGLKKVELENTIQDYEDKILDQKYYPTPPANVGPASQAGKLR